MDHDTATVVVPGLAAGDTLGRPVECDTQQHTQPEDSNLTEMVAHGTPRNEHW